MRRLTGDENIRRRRGCRTRGSVAATGSQGPDAAQPVDSPGSTIFTALQEQLGLRLDSAKGPVESVVIDRVDRPSPN